MHTGGYNNHRSSPGNAWSDPEIDNRAALEFWWSHAILSTETRDGALKYCDFSAIGPLVSFEIADAPHSPCCRSLSFHLPLGPPRQRADGACD